MSKLRLLAECLDLQKVTKVYSEVVKRPVSAGTWQKVLWMPREKHSKMKIHYIFQKVRSLVARQYSASVLMVEQYRLTKTMTETV